MDDSSAYAVQVLNTLIEPAFDSASGYEKAAEMARNPRFTVLFRERADARRRLGEDLASAVRALGGEPASHGSVLGPAHRLFISLRDKVGKDSDKPLIEEVERGEDFLRGRLAQAIEAVGLPEPARETISRACGQVTTEHGEIAALKDEFH
jgi:uncharacterized protein (TIGR02284 family)